MKTFFLSRNKTKFCIHKLTTKSMVFLFMKKFNLKLLLINLFLSLGAGILGTILSGGTMQQNLYQPPLAPPGWLFPIVWTILYILMGIAAYRISLSNSLQKEEALRWYFAQLIANVGWTVLFFRFDAYWLSFFWLLLLWYLIFMTLKRFYEIDKIAGLLLVPYLIWVTFAGYLNLAIAINSYFINSSVSRIISGAIFSLSLFSVPL